MLFWIRVLLRSRKLKMLRKFFLLIQWNISTIFRIRERLIWRNKVIPQTRLKRLWNLMAAKMRFTGLQHLSRLTF